MRKEKQQYRRIGEKRNRELNEERGERGKTIDDVF